MPSDVTDAIQPAVLPTQPEFGSGFVCVCVCVCMSVSTQCQRYGKQGAHAGCITVQCACVHMNCIALERPTCYDNVLFFVDVC